LGIIIEWQGINVSSDKAETEVIRIVKSSGDKPIGKPAPVTKGMSHLITRK
jgi:hypothetical protein